METPCLGAGPVGGAFWLFIAAVVVGGMWYASREKQMKQETLRQIVRSGRDIDQETIDPILSDGEAFVAVTGVAALVLCIALGLLAAARYVGRRKQLDVI